MLERYARVSGWDAVAIATMVAHRPWSLEMEAAAHRILVGPWGGTGEEETKLR